MIAVQMRDFGNTQEVDRRRCAVGATFTGGCS
jgi:hypothetical protein